MSLHPPNGRRNAFHHVGVASPERRRVVFKGADDLDALKGPRAFQSRWRATPQNGDKQNAISSFPNNTCRCQNRCLRAIQVPHSHRSRQLTSQPTVLCFTSAVQRYGSYRLLRPIRRKRASGEASKCVLPHPVLRRRHLRPS